MSIFLVAKKTPKMAQQAVNLMVEPNMLIG